MVESLQSGDITKIGIGVIVALVVIGLLLSMIITALIGRVILLVIVIALGAWVWQQRTAIKDDFTQHKCSLGTTFFGIHVQAPKDVQQVCQAKGS